MENEVKMVRFTTSYWMPFLSGVLFLIIFYISYFAWWMVELSLSSMNVLDFAQKYWVYLPIVYGLILIVLLYIAYLLLWIVRANFWQVKFLVLAGVFGWNVFFWYQLLYLEPRYTDVAIFIIDSYARHIFYASIWVLVFVLLSVFLKRKV